MAKKKAPSRPAAKKPSATGKKKPDKLSPKALHVKQLLSENVGICLVSSNCGGADKPLIAALKKLYVERFELGKGQVLVNPGFMKMNVAPGSFVVQIGKKKIVNYLKLKKPYASSRVGQLTAASLVEKAHAALDNCEPA